MSTRITLKLMPSLTGIINNQQLTVNKRKGFTLIELLVVIAIIGILATFVVASFNSAQARGRDSKRKTDLDAVKKALELAKADCNNGAYYPQMAGVSNDLKYNALEAYLDDTDLNYIKVVPVDPNKTGASDYHDSTDNPSGLSTGTDVCPDGAGGRTQEGDARFLLRALLENKSDSASTTSITQCSVNGAVAVLGEAPYYVCND